MKALLATWMPRVNEIITLIGSHNLLTTPTRSQLDDAALRPLIDEMLHGADGTPADERAALFRMAWDFVGTTLAGRGFLYERFYLTSATRNRQLLHRGFDRTRANCDRRRDARNGIPATHTRTMTQPMIARGSRRANGATRDRGPVVKDLEGDRRLDRGAGRRRDCSTADQVWAPAGFEPATRGLEGRNA